MTIRVRCNKGRRPVSPRVTTIEARVPAGFTISASREEGLKAQLVARIASLMKERGLKQIEAAGLFGVKQPDVSRLLRGDVRQFSLERLLRFLVALGQDVEIVVKPSVTAGSPS